MPQGLYRCRREVPSFPSPDPKMLCIVTRGFSSTITTNHFRSFRAMEWRVYLSIFVFIILAIISFVALVLLAGFFQ